MREIVFLKRYKEKWEELEKSFASGQRQNPDHLSELFIQLTDDLSYARTFYPESKTTQYLNQLSVQLHRQIYRNKKERGNRFVTFWVTEIPLTVAKHHAELGIAFLVFALAFSIGWLSAANDAGYVRLMLGDGYVNRTIDNIDSGKPMNIYGGINEAPMFLYIAANNIYVTFYYFAFGLLFGMGSLFFLFREGLRIGAFLQFFYSRDVLTDAMLAVWIHGTVEISVIIIACGAGLALGSGIVFPRTYKRSVSFMNAAKDGIKIVIGLVPFLFLAAALESFVTRHYNVVPLVSLGIIFLSLALIVTYFIVWPLILKYEILKPKDAAQGFIKAPKKNPEKQKANTI